MKVWAQSAMKTVRENKEREILTDQRVHIKFSKKKKVVARATHVQLCWFVSFGASPFCVNGPITN